MSGLVGITYHERGDTIPHQLVDDIVIKPNTKWVYRTVSAARGDNTRPGNAETIGIDAVGFHQRNIFPPSSIRVGCNVSIAIVQCFCRRTRETVPDRWPASVNICGSFDLESSYSKKLDCELGGEIDNQPVAKPHRKPLGSLYVGGISVKEGGEWREVRNH